MGVQLNLERLELSYYLQSRFCKKQKIHKIPANSNEWFPLIEFKEKGQIVTFNPFRDKPVPETTSAQQITRLPEQFTFSSDYAKISIMEHLIGNQILLYKVAEEKAEFNMDKTLENIKACKFDIVA